jgi:Na+/H+ antiporter NhaA
MSLFIGLLAFDEQQQIADTKLAVLVASLLSALIGAVTLIRPPAK